jgi:hypothetical protein
VARGRGPLDGGTRQIPTVDIFSFTQGGQPWAYQSWLMEIALYLALRSGGLPLAITLHALAITAAYGILLVISRTAAGGNLRWAVLATLAAAIASPNWNLRPQTLSIPCLPDPIVAGAPRPAPGERQDRGLVQDPALWLLPLIFLLWANGHGGFIFGLALLACYGWPACGTGGATAGPFPSNCWPWPGQRPGHSGHAAGTGHGPYVLEFMRNPVTRLHNVEFMPPTVRTLDGQLFFAFVLLAAGYCCWPAAIRWPRAR